jgi:hypothetical protein
MYNTDLPTRAELPSTGKLLRSTVIAALIAAVLLVTTVLPAEYGIDPTGIGRSLGLTQMGEIKKALSADAAADKTAPALAKALETAPTPSPAAKPAAQPPAESPVKGVASGQQHTMTVKLKPGQGAEIKLTMLKDAKVSYEWTTEGGPVNYDTHGDPVNAPKSFYHGYGKGRNTASDTGTLQAAFDGSHGWFWRNRTNVEVTVTLKTSGDYTQIKRVL